MSTKEENPWLLVDEPDDEVIVGNRAGLISLRDKIDKILENAEEDPSIGFEDTNINRIVLESKEKYLGNINYYKETFCQKIAGSFVFIWFAVLPFIGVGLSVYLLFFNEEKSKFNMPSNPMQNCVKNVFPFKP